VTTVDLPTTEDAHHEEAPSHPATSTGLTNEKVAMWAFLGSECLLFGGLISTYLLYKGQSEPGTIRPHDIFDIPYTSVSSFVLLMSSLTMVLALSAIQKGNHRALRVWLLTTALLGGSFVAGQCYEFTVFVREGLNLRTNLFGSSFYIMTGFHGAHVTGGVIWLLAMWWLAVRGRLGAQDSLKVEICGLYWHFVDIVWIVIFALIYLIP